MFRSRIFLHQRQSHILSISLSLPPTSHTKMVYNTKDIKNTLCQTPNVIKERYLLTRFLLDACFLRTTCHQHDVVVDGAIVDGSGGTTIRLSNIGSLKNLDTLSKLSGLGSLVGVVAPALVDVDACDLCSPIKPETKSPKMEEANTRKYEKKIC